MQLAQPGFAMEGCNEGLPITVLRVDEARTAH
jgi:hypothetical protein